MAKIDYESMREHIEQIESLTRLLWGSADAGDLDNKTAADVLQTLHEKEVELDKMLDAAEKATDKAD